MRKSTSISDWKYILGKTITSLTNKIKRNELALSNIYDLSNRSATKQLLASNIARIQSDLMLPNRCDELYINNFISELDSPIRYRTALIGKDIQNTLKDLLIFIKDAEDILDIPQLIQEQTQPNITAVWIFAEIPIEYSGTSNKDVIRLKQSVLENLYRGVKYIYFVSKQFDATKISKGIVNDIRRKYKKISNKRINEIKRNIEIRIIDERFFLTYFTLHFRSADDYDIFLSTLHPERLDLMIRVRDEFKKRIAERIDNLIIYHSIDPEVKIINTSGIK